MSGNKVKQESDDVCLWAAADDGGAATDLDWSFTSSNGGTTSSARTSITRSSFSFNDRLSSASAVGPRSHRGSDPQWFAIRAATAATATGLQLRHLKLVRHLGTGNMGRVFLCRLRDCSDDDPSGLFAMKVVDNDRLSLKKAGQARTESDILASLDHPFLPTLYARIDASHYTCLLIDYCPAGDLHARLHARPALSCRSVRFLAAEVLLALEYLHSIGIVYRDLKPENILLRADGHVMLSDFDLCFTGNTPHRVAPLTGDVVAEPTSAWSRSCVGTHEYLAPEVVAGTGHGCAVDWWAFGVLLHELLHGATPFKGPTKEATLRNIASLNATFGRSRGKMGRDADDLVRQFLVKDPAQRLGAELGAAEIKRHPFFKGVKWALIRNRAPPRNLLNAKAKLRRWWTNPFSSS